MLLSAVTFLPLVGALFMLVFISSDDESAVARSSRGVALLTTLATFVLSIFLYTGFDNSTADFQFVERYTWIKDSGIDFVLGIDGISLFFILLTTFLLPFCVLCSWKSVKTQVREYMVCFLLLESLVIGVFASLDFMSFYFFFEASLIPMYLIIGVWGGENKVYAAFKFFLYTLIGSVLLLLALIFIYNEVGTTYIPTLMNEVPKMSLEVQQWLWLAFFASFAVKVPMFPFHTWLPDAHVQAPTAGSVILAGVLLKLGGYGFLRFSLPMLPDASIYFTNFMYSLSVIAVIYTSVVALMQTDMKKLIAYSSIAHMGFVTIGIFAMNQQGIEGSIFQMISHGVVSAALFLCVGVVYDRIHTKEIARYGGLVTKMPKYALYFMLFTMASIGLPTTSGFVGEFLVLVGVYQDNTYVAALAATGLVLGAAYMLWLYKRVVFGELVHADLKKITDLDNREMLIFVPLAILVIVMGVFPNFILEPLHVSVVNLIQQINR